jgi:hypothetical protein
LKAVIHLFHNCNFFYLPLLNQGATVHHDSAPAPQFVINDSCLSILCLAKNNIYKSVQNPANWQYLKRFLPPLLLLSANLSLSLCLSILHAEPLPAFASLCRWLAACITPPPLPPSQLFLHTSRRWKEVGESVRGIAPP